jgi:branched-chain amino acid transport system substrate-binding protein
MNKARIFFIILAVVLGLTLGISPAMAQKGKPIKIGFMGNLSAPFSLSAQAAAKLAVEEMNASGGILGRPVELISEDTKGEIPKGIEVYKKLVMHNRVDAVVVAEKVEMGVAGAQIGAELFREFPHIMFCTIGGTDDIWHLVRDNYDRYKFAFHTYYFVATHYLQILGGQIIPDFQKNYVGAKKIALLYEDMAWTQPIRRGIPGVSPSLKEIYKSKGFDVVYEATISLDQKVFSTLFDDITKSGADSIDGVMGYIDQASFIKQWAQSSARDIPWFFWGGIAGMPMAWKMTDGMIAGGSIGSSFVRVPITEKTIPFMDNMIEKYKVGPIFGSHTTYDTLFGYKKALQQAGDTKDIGKVIHELENVKETAVLGTIGWDAKNHHNLPYPAYVTPIVQWQDGKMVPIYPKNIATGKFISPAKLRK